MQSSVDPGARREIRLLVRLAIATAFVALVVLVTPIVAWFSDLATILFLAWLLAFLIHPLAAWVARVLERVSYGAAVGLAYAIVGIVTAVVLATVGISLAQSITNFSGSGPEAASQLAAPAGAHPGTARQRGPRLRAPGGVDPGMIDAIDLGSAVEPRRCRPDRRLAGGCARNPVRHRVPVGLHGRRSRRAFAGHSSSCPEAISPAARGGRRGDRPHASAASSAARWSWGSCTGSSPLSRP